MLPESSLQIMDDHIGTNRPMAMHVWTWNRSMEHHVSKVHLYIYAILDLSCLNGSLRYLNLFPLDAGPLTRDLEWVTYLAF